MNLNHYLTNKTPVLFIGATGVGKTATVAAHFDYAEVVLVSSMVEEDIAGLPYREGVTEYRTEPQLFRRLREQVEQGKTTVLFLDELDKARRAVADTLLTLVASRKVGDWVLPESTHIVAAANPPEYGGGDGISPAMLSRFIVVDYVPSPTQWARWAESKFSSPITKAIINKVKVGEIPLIDINGDGLEMRQTCPRTITMFLQHLEQVGITRDTESVARGLLTAEAASLCLQTVTSQGTNKVMDKATGVKLTATRKNTAVTPIVL